MTQTLLIPIEEPVILIVEDDISAADIISHKAKQLGLYPIITDSISETESILNNKKTYSPSIIMLDVNLPDGRSIQNIDKFLSKYDKDQDAPLIILMTSDTNISASEITLLLREGKIVDYLKKPYQLPDLENMLMRNINLLQKKREIIYKSRTNNILQTKSPKVIIGESPAIKALLDKISSITGRLSAAPHDHRAPILMYGETGTGKEIFSSYIHDLLAPVNSNFIHLDCGNMAKDLLESELFGYEKGSFTGASINKVGLCEVVQKGTLLIDEIGELPLDLQSKLLSFLERREFRPIGSNVQKKFHGNLIFATHRNLEKMVEDGLFRRDLLYRINTLTIELPPLRNRGSDILLLTNHYLSVYKKRYQFPQELQFSKDAENILLSHSWPGNIRELRNVIDSTLLQIGVDTHLIEPHDIANIKLVNSEEVKVKKKKKEENDLIVVHQETIVDFDKVSKEAVIKALTTSKNTTQAAIKLDITRSRLRYLLEKYNIKTNK